MHTLTHSHNSPAQTNGLVLRWATIYDRVMDVATLGKNQRLRKLTIDLAQLKPGADLPGCWLRHRRCDHPGQAARWSDRESDGHRPLPGDDCGRP